MNGTETATIDCPYCGEPAEVVVDLSVAVQAYTEDCPVCCRPMVLRIEVAADGVPAVAAGREDE